MIGLGIRFGVHNKHIGIWAIRDPELVSIQNVIVSCEKIMVI